VITSIPQLHKDKQIYLEFERFLEMTKNEMKLRAYTEIQEFREKGDFSSEEEKMVATWRIIAYLRKLDLPELNLFVNSEDLLPKDISEALLKKYFKSTSRDQTDKAV